MKRIKKFQPCEKCDNGFIHKEIDGEDTVERCECYKAYQDMIGLESKLERANLPLSIINYSIDSYEGEDKNNNLKVVENYINKFHKFKDWTLYFYGPVGTQKSTLLRYIGRELIKKKKKVYYTLADTLIKELIDSERDEELKTKWNDICKNYDLLIIDEMSEDKITTYQSGYQRKFILPFLKRRIEIYNKAVLFASNSPYDNIGQFFEGAIQDLIYRETKAQLTFEDNYKQLADSFDISELWN